MREIEKESIHVEKLSFSMAQKWLQQNQMNMIGNSAKTVHNAAKCIWNN